MYIKLEERQLISNISSHRAAIDTILVPTELPQFVQRNFMDVNWVSFISVAGELNLFQFDVSCRWYGLTVNMSCHLFNFTGVGTWHASLPLSDKKFVERIFEVIQQQLPSSCPWMTRDFSVEPFTITLLEITVEFESVHAVVSNNFGIFLVNSAHPTPSPPRHQ